MLFLFIAAVFAAAEAKDFFDDELPELINKAAKDFPEETFEPSPTGVPFVCTQDLAPSSPPPTSVNALRPADISLVAALGDSITAAYGANATTILTDTVQYRGQSWDIGMQSPMEALTTMPSIFQKFNPSLYGGSVGNGDQNNANSRLNVAVSGAIAKDMPTQANALVTKLKARSDFNTAWKMVSLWIGGNDLCRFCDEPRDPAHTPTAYTGYIEQAFDILLNNVPKVFVNMIQIMDITELYQLHEGTCDYWHNQVCFCAAGNNAAFRAEASNLAFEYQKAINNMLKAPKWTSRGDFAIVVQPFFTQTTIPRKADGQPDRSYFAPDCFHFATKTHEGVGISLWNNIIQPVGAKSTKWVPGVTVQCPTNARPYLFTNANSLALLANNTTSP